MILVRFLDLLLILSGDYQCDLSLFQKVTAVMHYLGILIVQETF
jgi:hypothetical protein